MAKELESFCMRMSMRGSDRKLTPEGQKWHDHAETVRDARKKMVFMIAKVTVPESIMDESWSVYKPFRNQTGPSSSKKVRKWRGE